MIHNENKRKNEKYNSEQICDADGIMCESRTMAALALIIIEIMSWYGFELV